MATLAQDALDFYRENGYLLYHQPLFSAEKFERLRGIFEEHLAEKGDTLSDELDTPHFRDPRLLEFLLSDEVLDLVEPITGPNIALWSSHFICKDPFTGRATPWHEDSAYWQDRLEKHEGIVTVWLALDRSTKENGCMRVIPGTHRNGFSSYAPVDMKDNTFHSEITDEIDESKAVYFELEPNECSLHDARIVHGATPNRSPYRRCGYTMRYMPASNRMIPERNRGHRLWLARGTNAGPNSYVNA
jgi:ectoine hydroxylase-related dioxygenase (phytanoyl-CoA dioxygenase family)